MIFSWRRRRSAGIPEPEAPRSRSKPRGIGHLASPTDRDRWQNQMPSGRKFRLPQKPPRRPITSFASVHVMGARAFSQQERDNSPTEELRRPTRAGCDVVGQELFAGVHLACSDGEAGCTHGFLDGGCSTESRSSDAKKANAGSSRGDDPRRLARARSLTAPSRNASSPCPHREVPVRGGIVWALPLRTHRGTSKEPSQASFLRRMK